MQTLAALCALAVPLLLGVRSGAAQPSEQVLQTMQQDLATLKDGMHSLQKDLQELKTLLRPRSVAEAPPDDVPQPGSLRLDGVPVQGDPRARLVLIDFTDYQCPFCARHAWGTVPQLETEYIQTGKLRYALRDFPLESIHPQAFKAAEATHCAAEQGKYWELHDRLFAHQRNLSASELPGHAQGIGLDVPTFQQCLDSGKHAATVRAGLSEGQKAGVRGTPTFFLGVAADNGEVKVVKVLRGAQEIGGFKAAIDGALAALR